jgi:hypothetical protein
MSSTSNAQDLLVNVFRPTYRWDSTTGFVPSLTVSNVTEIITGSVQTARLAVTDTNLNTYIGRDAGASATDTASNVGLGYSAMAGAVNSSNNVAVGMFSLDGMSNSDSNVALGARTDITGRGQRNVLIGPNVTMGDGSGNILIGADISAGNVSKRFQLGTLLYGDLSSGYVGINTSTPAAALDISGIVVFRNKVGFQNPNPDYSLDVAGSVFASEQIIGGKGTQSNPMYTFKDTPGSGMYIPVDPSYGTGSFAIAVNRAPAAIFSSNAVNFFQNLDVSGTFSARNIDISAFSVTNGTPGIPSVTFTNDTSTGLYLAASNRLGVTTGGLRRMEVLSNGDVSMGRLVTKDISYSGTIVGTDPNTCNVIGGVTLCNGNVILTGTATNSNLLVPGWIRNTTTAFVLDISSGNISNSLTTRSSNFRASAGTAGAPAYSFASDATTGVHSAGTSQLAFDTAGVQRMVISNGNVGIGKATPVVALEVVGDVSATTYNGPGGTQSAPHYTFSDDRTTGLFFPGANMIGLSAGGTERVRISNSNIGIGTTAPTNALDVSGTLRVIGTAGDLTFTNGTISLAGVPVISSTGVLSNATSTSNSIGGVTLSNTNIAYAGAITGSTAGASNRIGGVTLSNTNIAYAGTITGSTDDTSNKIGGVTLSNTNITLTGTTTSANFRATGGGAAAFPAYSFSNATQTGMLHSGGFLQFAISGETRFQISANTTTVSNQLAVTDGTAAAPGYAFTSDTGLGLFRAGANQLALATGGQTRFQVSSATTTVSNQLAVTDGTAAAPGYAFTNDTGLGVFRPGANQLALATSGSNRMIVLADGKVGFGTTAPGTQVEVAKVGTGVTADLRIRAGELGGASTANKAILRLSQRGSTGGDVENGFQADYTTNYGISVYGDTAQSYVRFDGTNSRVGIGTSAPAFALDVSGVTNVQTAGAGGTLNVGGSMGLFMFCDAAATKHGYIRALGSTANLYLGTSNTNHMMITNGGLVGIGTTAPGQKLDVSATFRVGNSKALFDVTPQGASGDYAVTTTNGHFVQYRGGSTNKANSNVVTYLTTDVGASSYFLSNNIGIGTTAPAYSLDISTGGNTVPLALRAAGFTGGGNNMIELFANSTAATPVRRIGLGVTSSTGSGNDGNDFSVNTYTDAGGYFGTPLIVKRGTGRVGIGTTTPGYALDVVASATDAAAVNMSTWARTGLTCLLVNGASRDQPRGNVISLNTPTQSISSQLATFVADDATMGNSLYIVRAGIWSFSFYVPTNNNTAAVWLDASTNNTTNNVGVGTTGNPVLTLFQGPYAQTGGSYTGYITSNVFIKLRMTATAVSTISMLRYSATFLGEVGFTSTYPL